MNGSRKFLTLLALAALTACSEDRNPVAPLAAPESEVGDYIVVGALSYSTPYEQAAPIVQGYESQARSMGEEVGVSAPTLSAGVAMTGVAATGLGTTLRKGGRQTPGPIAFYLPNGCRKAYIDCVQDCLLTRIEFQNAAGDFWRADNDYWEHILTGRDYLNHQPGGPQDLMYSALVTMSAKVRQYRAGDCSNYL